MHINDNGQNMSQNNKLELTWVGKKEQPRLQPVLKVVRLG